MNNIKSWIKKAILFIPNGDVILGVITKGLRKIGIQPSAVPKDVFTYYYHNNTWGNPESVSGAGSTIDYTENIRRELPVLLEQYKIKKFLDAPCGDYNWFRAIKRPIGMEYIGGDIVDELIVQNRKLYGDQHTTFISLDIITDMLPASDLWMCRDCLFHFSYDHIFKTFLNFMRSDINLILTSVHTECTENIDIVTGGARQLNLELFPFNLCQPILYINDWIPGYTVRKMGLWTKSMIVDSIAPALEKYTV